ncbi:MAG: hypothetical protein ACK2T3_06025, partial [Candidatus Promineifilaceae bacterium]
PEPELVPQAPVFEEPERAPEAPVFQQPKPTPVPAPDPTVLDMDYSPVTEAPPVEEEGGGRSRTVWIIALVLIFLCCCVLVATVLIITFATNVVDNLYNDLFGIGVWIFQAVRFLI